MVATSSSTNNNSPVCSTDEYALRLKVIPQNGPAEIFFTFFQDDYDDLTYASTIGNYVYYNETSVEDFCFSKSICYKFLILDYHVYLTQEESLYGSRYELYEDNNLVKSKQFSTDHYSFEDDKITLNDRDSYSPCETSSPSASPYTFQFQQTIPGLSLSPSAAPSTLPTSYTNTFMNGYDVFPYLVFLGFILVCCLTINSTRERCLNRTAIESNANNANPNLHFTFEENNVTNNLNDEQRRQNRRLAILTAIIHKRVVQKSHVESDVEIILPHEECHSNHDVQKKINTIGEHSTAAEAQDPHFPHDGMNIKDDIHAPSMRSLRSTMNIASERTSSSLYSPKLCPICLEAYKVNEEIAWSKNDHCYHAFHLDCIMEWLMENYDCPMCRREYFSLDDIV